MAQLSLSQQLKIFMERPDIIALHQGYLRRIKHPREASTIVYMDEMWVNANISCEKAGLMTLSAQCCGSRELKMDS
jgi:hypothetical protein